MLAMQAAVAKLLAAIHADQPAALKSLLVIHVALLQPAVLKSLLAIHVQLLHVTAAVSVVIMVACSLSSSSTRSLAAMKLLAMLAQPPAARPADRLQLQLLLLLQLPLQHPWLTHMHT